MLIVRRIGSFLCRKGTPLDALIVCMNVLIPLTSSLIVLTLLILEMKLLRLLLRNLIGHNAQGLALSTPICFLLLQKKIGMKSRPGLVDFLLCGIMLKGS